MIEPYKVGTEVKFKPIYQPYNLMTLRGIIIESNYTYGEIPWYKIDVRDFEKGVEKGHTLEKSRDFYENLMEITRNL